MSYYYFIASLPYVNYGDKPPMSSGEFEEQCKNFLTAGDLAHLRFCKYNPRLAIETVKSTGSDFVDLLMLRERNLVLNLAFFRASKLNRASPGDPPHDMPRVEAVAKTAIEMENPFDAALFIDRARWGALDEVSSINYFGANTIFAYLLKLQLLERKQVFDTIKGTAAYHELYNTILNEYNSKVKEAL